MPDESENRLTPEEQEAIAERAARKALQLVYAEVGQSVLRKLGWLLGIALLALLVWLAGKNALPLSTLSTAPPVAHP